MVVQQHPLQQRIANVKANMGAAAPPAAMCISAAVPAQGSTCAMVESVLRHAGYRTGLYTSPHLVDVRERIRLDGWAVSNLHSTASTAPHSVSHST